MEGKDPFASMVQSVAKCTVLFRISGAIISGRTRYPARESGIDHHETSCSESQQSTHRDLNDIA